MNLSRQGEELASARRHSLNGVLLITLLARSLSACTLLPQAEQVPIQTYQLSVQALQPQPGPGPSTRTKTLLVQLPRAQAGFDTSRMVYLQRPHQMEYYAHNQWADPPAHLLSPLLIRALEQTQVWHAVVQLPAAVRGDYRLDTEIVHWQHEFLTQPSIIRLALRAQVVDLEDHSVLASQRFEVVEAAPSDDPYGGVTAANRAAPILVRHVAQWVQRQTANPTQP